MIFIVGNSRSGTTMMGRMLGLHSKVFTFGELHFLEQLVGVEEFIQNRPWPHDKAQKILEQLLTRSRDGFFAPYVRGRHEADAWKIIDQAQSLKPAVLYAVFMSYETQRSGRFIPCEQTPKYLFSSKEILQIYPEARIINMIRDPRDVLISQRSKWKRRFLGGGSIPMREAVRAWCNYHPWLVSRLWISCVDYANSIKDNRFMSIRFEDLLIAPDQEMKKVCNFLAIPFEREMLDAPQIGSSSGVDSPEKRGINKDRANGWKKHGMPIGERLLCEWVCNKRMRELDYDNLMNEGQFSPRVLPPMLLLPGKLGLAIIFNLKRFPKLFASLRRRMSSPNETT